MILRILAQALHHCLWLTNQTEKTMTRANILDWTDAQVQLKLDMHRDVKYQVYRDGMKNFLEVRSANEEPIHTLELPDGMKLDRSSYEVLLRYVLLDVVAA
jgi:hypothetical protein